jgi:PAS domain S-box-containing protein
LSVRGRILDADANGWRKDMEQAASDLNDGFFALSIDMLCIAHFNGYFERLNPAWEKTLGFSREELQAQPMFEFVHPEDRERTIDQNRRVRSGGQALAFENRYRCKDGSYKWLLWNATADPEQQVIYSVARDITERKQAEQEREQLLRELQTAIAEVKELQKILPICMYCKNIRDDENYWQTVEDYVSHHTNTRFSHGICPTCYANVVEPQFGGPKKD